MSGKCHEVQGCYKISLFENILLSINLIKHKRKFRKLINYATVFTFMQKSYVSTLKTPLSQNRQLGRLGMVKSNQLNS